jgi:hypothetical protein
MTIYWIKTESDDVFAALAAVEQALASDNVGQPLSTTAPAASDTDSYLTDNLAAARSAWAVDPHAIVVSSRPGLAPAINLFQQLVRRLTWWQTLPQWQQISSFHGALVRIIDVLLDRQRLLGVRVNQLESLNAPAHLFALEQQIQALRDEQRLLRRQIAELERQLAAQGAPTRE